MAQPIDNCQATKASTYAPVCATTERRASRTSRIWYQYQPGFDGLSVVQVILRALSPKVQSGSSKGKDCCRSFAGRGKSMAYHTANGGRKHLGSFPPGVGLTRARMGISCEPIDVGLMWMKGWRCTECGHEDDPLYRHNCYLRQGASEVSMIASELGRGLRAAGIEALPRDPADRLAPQTL